MASDIPAPLLIVGLSAAEAFAQQTFLPDLLPNVPLTALYLSFAGANFFLWAIWCILIYPIWFSPMRNVPKPKGSNPLLGFGGVEFRTPRGSAFLEFMKTTPNTGLLRVPGFLNRDQLVPTTAATLSDILVHNSYAFIKPAPLRDFLRLFLGNGLIIVEGDDHRFQRKHVAPAFKFGHIKDLYPLFWGKAREFSERMGVEVLANGGSNGKKGEGVVEINHFANKVTMDIIGVAGLGRNFNSLHDTDDVFVQTYEEILEPTKEKMLYFVLNMFLPMVFIKMLPWKMNQKLEDVTSTLRKECIRLVEEKRRAVEKKGEDHVDILSLLIKSNDFSDEMLVDQLLTFLAAGHETTSSAFTWATYLLAKNPTIQTALRAEIRNALSASTPPSQVSDIIESLPLLHGVCQETLRLYPTVPSTIRIAAQDTHIGDVAVPKDTKVFLVPWAINRSEEHWGADAEVFKPERWATVEEKDGERVTRPNNTGGVSSNYSMLTFLHGPRSCIGQKFAIAEMKALVAVFVGAWDIEMAVKGEVAEPAGAITTKPKNGMHVRLRKLDGW